MAILAFDWGGTNIKYGVWANNQLESTGSEKTPETYTELKEILKRIQDEKSLDYTFEGVAISAPGVVNIENGVIEGISAIPYIHHFNIREELVSLFGLPVKIENDANAAGIAEVWQGVAQGEADVLFVVIGTGVGGAIIQDGKVRAGSHRFSGEFGLMYVDESHTFSNVGTAVKMAQRYAKRTNQDVEQIDAKKVFDLAEAGDSLAIEEVEKFYNYLARSLFSLQFVYDPSCIVIGGGVSAKEGLESEVSGRIQKLLDLQELNDFSVDVRVCQFGNDANLIGAVASFYQQMEAN